MNNTNSVSLQLINTKLIIIISILISIYHIPLYAQVNTESDTIGIRTDSAIIYLTPMEYAFMMHEETFWLFKANVILKDGYRERYYLNIGIERRIAPSFSLNFEIDQSAYETQDEYHIPYNGIQSILEARWYYRLNKRVKQKNVARNMSDNYLSLGLGYTHIIRKKENDFISVYAKWGLQRRFLKYGHTDIGIKAGVGFPLNNNYSPFFVFNTFVNFGVAFTKDRYKLDREKLCPVLKCYEADKFLIKSNLSSLISASLFNRYTIIEIAPHIAFERKIGHSSFSVNTELQPVFGYSKMYDVNQDRYYEGIFWTAKLLLEGRWYYNLKRRILKGKTGNGLSASYIAVGGSYNYYKPKYELGYFRPDVYITTGWQRLFSKHLYFDINIGVGYDAIQSYESEIYPRIRIAVGYRF